MNAVAVPVHSDSTPYIMSTISDSLLTPLHDGVLECMELLQKDGMQPNPNLMPMIPAIFSQLLSFSKFSCVPPTFDRLETRCAMCIDICVASNIFICSRMLIVLFYPNRPMKSNRNHHSHNQNHKSTIEWVSMNYIPFGEKALNVAVKLYQQTASEPTVIEGRILHEIVKALQIPLALKYRCMASSTWKLAITSLMSVLHVGLKVARQHPEPFGSMWPDLSDTLDNFLFPSRYVM